MAFIMYEYLEYFYNGIFNFFGFSAFLNIFNLHICIYINVCVCVCARSRDI